MKWSRELRIARRGMRTALRAASAVTKAHARLPAAVRAPAWSTADGFGSNPGRLSMFLHEPPKPPEARAPLIVLLHGCGQTAAAFARDSGWVRLADRLGLPLLLPEQSGENNRGRCFNWFRPMHTARGHGEAASIRQMVEAAIDRFGSDPTRVFVAGLSAGGAMAAALLAAYPDVFAAGAVVAGLPVGAAGSAAEALTRMAEAGPTCSRESWAQRVRRAAPTGYGGPWPRVSIWHGAADDVVDPTNARLLAEQWSAVHGLDSAVASHRPNGTEQVLWGDPAQPSVELWMLPDLPHGWPPETVDEVARFWGLDQG